MARTKRAQRAATAAKAEGATPAQKRAAHAVIRAEKRAAQMEADVRAGTKTFEELSEEKTGFMDVRGQRWKTGETQSIEDTIAAANQARAYADAMRRITGRQKGQGTAYTGPGVTVGESGVADISGDAYGKRFLDPTTTPWQNVNLQWMLEQGTGEGDIQDVRARRKAFRENIWGDVLDPDTGRWVRGDRAEALKEQQRRFKAGEVPVPTFDGDNGNGDNGNGDNGNGDNGNGDNGNGTKSWGTGRTNPILAQMPFNVRHMRRGGLWEGLGAEYQPGTVEGLSLLGADKPITRPYDPMRKSLLGPAANYLGEPEGMTPFAFKRWSGTPKWAEGATTTTTNNNNTGPVFGYKWDASADKGKGANIWTRL